MASHTEAEQYLSELGRARPIAESAHAIFAEMGCSSYVKTIYIGYEISGEMVAAMYGHADHVEVALAVPSELQHPLLADASHLTWRTLPLAATVRTEVELLPFRELAELACSRVRSAEHDVTRDNDFFIAARRQRRNL